MRNRQSKFRCFRPWAALAAVSLAFSAFCAAPAEGERIVYSSYGSGNWEIWSIASDGTDAVQLTQSLRDETAPALTPDGSQIAYANNVGEIWVAAADGASPRKLTLPAGHYSQPCWTPDGAKLVVCMRPSPLKEQADLHFVDARDGAQTNAALLVEMPGYETFPSCSPDGKQVVFSHFEIREEEKRLPRKPVVEELYILDVPTGSVRQLTRLGKNSTAPCYSPDGKSIAFASNAEGTYDLWVVDVAEAGSRPSRLTQDPGYEGEPCWSPDGSRLAFVSSRSGNLEVWSADRQGGDWRRVTTTAEGRDSTRPSWRKGR